MGPTFSAIIPAYNRADLLPETIRSVLQQRFEDYEIIVVDDGSTDSTVAVAQAMGPRVRVVRQPGNVGVAAARSAGIRHAAGSYVALLDSDDVWFPWTLETYQQCITRFGEPAFISADGAPFRKAEELAEVVEMPSEATRHANYLSYLLSPRQGLCLPSGVVIRSDHAKKVAGMSDKIIYREDNDLFLRLGTADGFVRISRPHCWGYRKHERNISYDFGRVVRGTRQILDEERAGQYPGGSEHRRARLREVTSLACATAIRCARRHQFQEGWRLYRQSFRWNLERFRWKFILGFPLLVMWKARSRLLAGRRSAAPAFPAQRA